MTMTESDLLKLVDQEVDSIVELARKLIRFNTTTPIAGEEAADEKECQEFIAHRLETSGFEIDIWEPENDRLKRYPNFVPGRNFQGRPNVVGCLKGLEQGRSLILNFHIDAVTPQPVERWRHDPWSGELDAGRIYGRGACDMKGGAAAAIAATEIIARAGVRLNGDLTIESVVDEEVAGLGTTACIDKGYRADAALIPEPVSSMGDPNCITVPVITRGNVYGKITVYGRAGHAEAKQPHWTKGGAVNAIEKATLVLRSLHDLEVEWTDRADKTNKLLTTPKIVPTLIRGGEWWQATIPEKCEIYINVPYMPANSDEKGFGGLVRKEIEDHVNAVAGGDPWLRHNPVLFTWSHDIPPAEIGQDEPIVRTVFESSRKLGYDPVAVGLDSWGDASNLISLGRIPATYFGPGRLDQAHAIDEFVEVSDLVRFTKGLVLILMQWCGHQ